MTYQPITQATALSITLLTTELPLHALPLARIALNHCTDKHLPDNIKALVKSLFSTNPLANDDPVYCAFGELMDIAIADDRSDVALARSQKARDLLISEGALHYALAVTYWLNQVQCFCAADGVPEQLH